MAKPNELATASVIPLRATVKRAVDEPLSAPPGVTLTNEIRADVYRGTMAALMAAGLAEVQQFPGRPGAGKCMMTFAPDGTRRRSGFNWPAGADRSGAKVIRRLKNARFEIAIEVSEEEHGRRFAQWSAEQNAIQRGRTAADAALVAAQFQAGQVAALPQSAEAFRARHRNYLELVLGGQMFNGSLGGYSYSAFAKARIRACAEQLLAVHAHAEITFDQLAFDNELYALRREAERRSALPVPSRPSLAVVPD